MKKLIPVLALMMVLSLASNAQSNYEEVVYLKNGSIVHGMIVEFVPNTSIKIKSGDNLFAYKFDEIEKITRELPASGSKAGGYAFKKKGYVGIAEIGLSDFPAGTNLPMFSINIVNAYQFNPYISLGAGVGADVSGQSIYGIPVTADFRAYFLKTRVTPFFATGLGYYLAIYGSDNILHGVTFTPSLGARASINHKLGVSLGVGYKLLAVTSASSDFVTMHGVTLKMGIHF